ncbi:glucose-6-phosphate isomerase family protein [Persicobacter psychrovividus]|uniref:glucose-6-phosphate isomerase n=1 Tax=Persicobacter psychrovividus TaxID=387638 RepID=A0ABM7VHV8_9BACT|nr:glucose-6-phosphate isomerase [Persicobacter psychrovividus]
MALFNPKVFLTLTEGKLEGTEIKQSYKYLNALAGVFKNETARAEMDQDALIYEVQAYMPVEEGKSGGLFFGNSTIYPGKVDQEYFMTRGHFHSNFDTAEYYWGVKGEGYLILMDENRKIWAEKMTPGSVHYIPGKVAHRVANTGSEPLVFNACWPSDAGHDYESIAEHGFSARLLEVDGEPKLVEE